MALPVKTCLSVFGLFLALFAAVYADRKQMEEDQIKVGEFDVKPGAGRQEHEDTWEDYTCKFTYQAQGGTKEQWVMGLSRSKDQSEYVCTVERPGGKSYLFFEEFKMEVNGQGLNLKEVEVEREPGVQLENKEYVIVTEKNMVMQWDGNFNSQLSKLEIYASKGKQEL